MITKTNNLPVAFLERLRKIIPPEKWNEVLKSFETPKPAAFRTNTLLITPEAVYNKLKTLGFGIEKVKWYTDAFILRKGSMRQLQDTDIYKEGFIYIQSLSSMIVPLVMSPKPGEVVLDIAAAPGSKTTQIACLMKGEGEIIANDNNRSRFYKLKANLKQQGVKNAKAMLKHGRVFLNTFPEYFDKVLVDVPCTTEGRFQLNEPRSFKYWKMAKIKEMVNRQKPLLYSAICTLREGGIAVYSTCTFAPEENEAVIDWVLKKFSGRVELLPIDLPITNTMRGICEWRGKEFDAQIEKTVRILPDDIMEGFFIACLHKRG